MSNGKVKCLTVIHFVGMFIKLIVPFVAARKSGQFEETVVDQQVLAITPISVLMVDKAMTVLSKGWSGMSLAGAKVSRPISLAAITKMAP
jgi:hypothetical protein